MKHYGKLTDMANYKPWRDDTLAVARAHCLEEIMEPRYRPSHEREAYNFQRKQKWFYAMLRKKIEDVVAKAIIDEHIHDSNAQMCMAKMDIEARKSTQAVISGNELLQILTSVQIDPGSNRSTKEFIFWFKKKALYYNEQQTEAVSKLSDPLLKTLLQKAVYKIPALRAVHERDREKEMLTNVSFSFMEYFKALKGVAETYDLQRGKRSRGVHQMNYHTLMGDEDDSGPNEQAMDDSSIATEINDYLVNEMRRRIPGSSMDRDTFRSLSDEAKATWDEIEPEDKKKILEGARKHASKPPTKKKRSVNLHEADTPQDDDETTDIDANEDRNVGDSTEKEQDNNVFDIHNAIATARGKAHPGDLRRLMGSTNPTKKKEPFKVGHHDLLPSNNDITSKDDMSASSEDTDQSNGGDYFGSYWEDNVPDFC
jgi:hypothetical protein